MRTRHYECGTLGVAVWCGNLEQDSMSRCAICHVCVDHVTTCVGHVTMCVGHVTTCVDHMNMCVGRVTTCVDHVTMCMTAVISNMQFSWHGI